MGQISGSLISGALNMESRGRNCSFHCWCDKTLDAKEKNIKNKEQHVHSVLQKQDFVCLYVSVFLREIGSVAS